VWVWSREGKQWAIPLLEIDKHRCRSHVPEWYVRVGPSPRTYLALLLLRPSPSKGFTSVRNGYTTTAIAPLPAHRRSPRAPASPRWPTRSRTTPPRPLCRNSRAPRSRSRPGRAPAPRAHAAPGVFGLGHDSPRSGTRSTPAGSPSFSRSGTRSSAPAHAARPRGPPPRLVPAEAAHRGSGRFSQGQHGERDAAASGATVHLPSVRLRTPCDHVTSSSC
jgi:hypothetical protein